MSIVKVNSSNFNEVVLKNEDNVIVDFYADWCGPCKMIAPLLEEIANERRDITIAKINVDESPELAQNYRIVSIPTLLSFKNGEAKSIKVGYCTKEAILGML